MCAHVQPGYSIFSSYLFTKIVIFGFHLNFVDVSLKLETDLIWFILDLIGICDFNFLCPLFLPTKKIFIIIHILKQSFLVSLCTIYKCGLVVKHCICTIYTCSIVGSFVKFLVTFFFTANTDSIVRKGLDLNPCGAQRYLSLSEN